MQAPSLTGGQAIKGKEQPSGFRWHANLPMSAAPRSPFKLLRSSSVWARSVRAAGVRVHHVHRARVQPLPGARAARDCSHAIGAATRRRGRRRREGGERALGVRGEVDGLGDCDLTGSSPCRFYITLIGRRSGPGRTLFVPAMDVPEGLGTPSKAKALSTRVSRPAILALFQAL